MFGEHFFNTVILCIITLTIQMLAAFIPMSISISLLLKHKYIYEIIDKKDFFIAYLIDIILYTLLSTYLFQIISLDKIIGLLIISFGFVTSYRILLYNKRNDKFTNEIGRLWFYGLSPWAATCALIAVILFERL